MARHWNAERARSARKAAGLTQAEVAQVLDVHRTTVVSWESGNDPQLRYAVALADLYLVSIDSLFIHDQEAATASAPGPTDDHESPGNTDAPLAVVSGATNAGSQEGALTKE